MLDIWFDSPPVHITCNGGLRIDPVDIFHSRKGQELIFSMRQNSGESISTPKRPKPKKRPASKPKI